MKLLFILFAVVGAVYFVFRRRKLDLFTVAYFSSVIYFMPGFFGYTLVTGSFTINPIYFEVYVVYLLVLSHIVFFSIIFDRNNKDRIHKFEKKALEKEYWLVNIFLFIGGLGFLFFLFDHGFEIFKIGSKVERLKEVGNSRWHILWAFGSILAFLMAYLKQMKLQLLVASGLLLMTIYIGHRSYAALTFLAFILIINKLGNDVSLFSKVVSQKYLTKALVIVLIGFFFFVYKGIGTHILTGRYDMVYEKLSDPTYYISSVTSSEPFTIQNNLNETLRRDIKNENLQAIDVFMNLLVFTNQLGYQQSGDYLAQDDLYRDLNFGAGNNIWAFIWSSSNWLGLYIFIFMFCFILWKGNKYILRTENDFLLSFLTIFFSYFAFYIHRNDLLFQINLQKRIVLVTVLALLLYVILLGKLKIKYLKIDQ